MSQRLTDRFHQLVEEANSIKAAATHTNSEYSGPSMAIPEDAFIEWCVKAKHLLDIACGQNSEHATAFSAAKKSQMMDNYFKKLTRLLAVVKAAKDDFEGGYLTSLRNIVHAEVFSNELDQATALLDAGYVSPAAVVAGVVLETNLRNLCALHGLPTGTMDRMNADLVKTGQYNVLTQKKITALAAIRNSAAHGKADDFNAQDVKGMIQSITDMLETWLS